MNYELITLNDVFNKVPTDKIEQCFKEFGVAFYQAAALRDFVELTSGVKGSITFLESHTWIDDDKQTVDIKITDLVGETVELHTQI